MLRRGLGRRLRTRLLSQAARRADGKAHPACWHTTGLAKIDAHAVVFVGGIPKKVKGREGKWAAAAKGSGRPEEKNGIFCVLV